MHDERDSMYWPAFQEPLPLGLEERIRTLFDSRGGSVPLDILEMWCREQGVWHWQGEWARPTPPNPEWAEDLGVVIEQRQQWERRLDTQEQRRLVCRQAIEAEGPDGRRAGPVIDLGFAGAVRWVWLDKMTLAERQAYEEERARWRVNEDQFQDGLRKIDALQNQPPAEP